MASSLPTIHAPRPVVPTHTALNTLTRLETTASSRKRKSKSSKRSSRYKPLPKLPIESFPLSPTRYYASDSSSGEKSPQSISSVKTVSLESIVVFSQLAAPKSCEVTIRPAEPGKVHKHLILLNNKVIMECKQGRINRRFIKISDDQGNELCSLRRVKLKGSHGRTVLQTPAATEPLASMDWARMMTHEDIDLSLTLLRGPASEEAERKHLEKPMLDLETRSRRGMGSCINYEGVPIATFNQTPRLADEFEMRVESGVDLVLATSIIVTAMWAAEDMASQQRVEGKARAVKYWDMKQPLGGFVAAPKTLLVSAAG